ncbi:MAG: SUMF1/EgtB/PvdO family nonheme iron enzyme [Cyanobacteriota bacterium]|nr:SUMF1/EgtB/PvdO family nonheme iron enzyme [Cyanobacteriota bacterium]
MASTPKTAALQSLERATGLTFVPIPAGTYQVGIAGELAKPALEQQSPTKYVFNQYFPETRVELPAFWIATDLFRLSHWQKLQQSSFAPTLQKIISSQDLENYKYNWVSDIKWGMNYGFKPSVKDKIEADPALTLTIEQSQALARILGTTLPSWAEWEVAARGKDRYLFPWGNTFDLSRVKLSNYHYSYTWEDPESTMGFRETESISGHRCRIDDFGEYTNAVSPFGLTGFMYWGMEWNTVDPADPNLEQTRKKYAQILRSLLDCGYSRATADLSDRETENQALRASNHRAFSGVPLAEFTSPDRGGKLAAFRLVYRPENVAEAAEPAIGEPDPRVLINEADWQLYGLLGQTSEDAIADLGEPESKESCDLSTGAMWCDIDDLFYYSRGLSITIERSYSRLSRPVSPEARAARVTAITLHTDTRNALHTSHRFVTYPRAIFTDVQLGLSRDRVMATSWKSEAAQMNLKVRFEFDSNTCLTKVTLER